MSIMRDEAIMIPVKKRTGLKSFLPKKVITNPIDKKIANIPHLLD